MRHRPLVIRLALPLGLLTVALDAAAQEASATGFALNRFEPSERGSEWFALDSQDYRGELRLTAGLVADWAHKPLVVVDRDGSDQVDSIVRNQVEVHPGASLVLWQRLRAAVSVPIAAYVDGQQGRAAGVTYSADDGAAMGDVRLGADALVLGGHGKAASLGAGVQLHLPTGSQEAFTTDGRFRLVPHAAFSGDAGLFAYAARVGTNLRFRKANFGGQAFGHELVMGASAGVRLLDRTLLLGPEIWCSTVVSDSGDGFLSEESTPVEGLLGAHYRFAEDWRVSAGAGGGLTSAFGAPKARGLASIEWAPSPKAKPLPPPESDGDGIVDSQDACPEEPGESSADPKRHGCPPPPPPPDSDDDGIADPSDACPKDGGVPNQDPKKNGCPLDGDRDGILDEIDACPETRGVASDDPEKNGCPPPADTDGDGVLDEQDHCPQEAGPQSADPAKNGCPLVQITEEQVVILEQIQFAKNSAEILEEESAPVLDAVLSVLQTHPEITKVRVEGHTDNTGNHDYNLRLSSKRAASVVTWLTQHGIERRRLASVGRGPDKPKAPNDTPDGRQQNRRVEFHIVDKSSETSGGAQ